MAEYVTTVLIALFEKEKAIIGRVSLRKHVTRAKDFTRDLANGRLFYVSTSKAPVAVSNVHSS